ncbi:MAG: SiaB family protein kinase [Bacteroidales bacterium]|nr:SiaB family protein kinase [Bacteroidales bacterium]
MTINSREIFNTMLDNDIVISYIGPFDGQILSLLASNIEDSLWDNQHRGKTFFKIFIELSQNIYLYSKEKGTGIDKSAGVGLMLIKEYDDHFAFITGNMVTKKDYELLSDKCKKICEKNKEELREFKRYMRGQPRTEFGGGNIGLIQVSILSGYPLDYSFIEVGDDDYFFILGVKIDK